MLQIKNLTITHRKDLRVILEDFHLTLNSGDKAVIIGEEGNGKSTLIKWIYDRIWQKRIQSVRVNVYAQRKDWGICRRNFPIRSAAKQCMNIFLSRIFSIIKRPRSFR